MNADEKERVNRITQAIDYLMKGRVPEPVVGGSDHEDEISLLAEKVNALILNVREVKEAVLPLSQGKLDILIPKQNFLASPFKNFQASLKHLTWQTKQIAKGDFSQKIDFMGDFSDAFNSMTSSLKEARAQLMSEITRFKELAEVKENYLNIMAHDIRTPIGAMIGFAEILLEENLSDNARKYVEIIRRNSDSLLGLINNILDMAKLEKHKMDVESVSFSLKMLSEDIKNIIVPKLAKGVNFIVEKDENIPEYLLGDPYRLTQVLMNLSANAAKFTQQGNITLKISIAEQKHDKVSLLFSIQDTGIGIPKSKLETIFMPFSQADKSIASRFGGTGLGLAISRELVTLMGGSLKVKSQIKKGTEFYFTIQLQYAEIKNESDAEYLTTCSCRGHILVVDDNEDVLNLIGDTLNKKGVKYSLCQDSRKAFNMLTDAYLRKDPFTLAWLDIDMPGMSGFDLAAKIRADQRFDSLRLIACTSDYEAITESEHPSYFSFVARKPVTQQALGRILKEAEDVGYTAECSFSDLSGLKLLLADDNPLNRFLVVHLMKKFDIEVVEAENGLEAVKKVMETRFDAVLMDRMMPVMDGEMAIRKIREKYDKNELHIFAFSAVDSEEDKKVMLDAGANGIMLKPIVHENMLENLCRIIVKK